MCVGSKTVPVAREEIEKPIFIRNPYLDSKTNKDGVASRTDRSSLMIPLEQSIGFEGRGGTGSGTSAGSRSDNTPGMKPRGAGSLTIGPSPKIDPLLPSSDPNDDYYVPPPRGPRTVETPPGPVDPRDPRRLPTDKKRLLIEQQR